MPLIHVIGILVLFGVGLWLINYVPWIDAKIKTIINVVIVIGAVIFLLHVFGLMAPLYRIRI